MHDEPRLGAAAAPDPVPWGPQAFAPHVGPSVLELGLLARLHARHATERLFRVVLPGRGSLIPAVVYVSPGPEELLLSRAPGAGLPDATRDGLVEGEVLGLLPPSLRRRLGGMAPGDDTLTFHHEFRVRDDGVGQRWAEVTGHGYCHDDGTLVIEGAVRDVSTAHRLRQADRDREARVRRMAEASSDVTLTVVRADDLRVQWCSANSASVLGVPASRLQGHGSVLLDHVHEEDRPALEAALRSPREMSVELRWRSDEGPRWVEVLVVPVRITGASTDALADLRIRLIDHQKRAQQMVRTAVRRVREADDALAQLEAVRRHVTRAVSHRVRTPLSVIHAATDTGLALGERLTPDRIRGLFGQIDRATTALTKLLEDLLTLPEAAELASGPPAPLDLTELVLTEVEATIGPPHRLAIEADGTVLALGVEDQLRRALRHLLGNVVDHTPPTSLVAVRVHRRDDTATVELVDDGPGIPDRILRRIGEPFVTGEADAANPGLGLGLALATRLARAQGGSLTVHRGDAGGTVARIDLGAWPPA